MAPAAGKTSLHRRGTLAANTHKHGDNGKQSVHAVQLSASLLYTDLTLLLAVFPVYHERAGMRLDRALEVSMYICMTYISSMLIVTYNIVHVTCMWEPRVSYASIHTLTAC